jgi:hypothetical protein
VKVLLADWAAKLYSPPPSPFVLRSWARSGQIYPAPERVGRNWYVEHDAVRQVAGAPRAPLVDRLRARAA